MFVRKIGKRVLDLGCGTGLELEEYFRLNPDAEVTGIDLNLLGSGRVSGFKGMLKAEVMAGKG